MGGMTVSTLALLACLWLLVHVAVVAKSKGSDGPPNWIGVPMLFVSIVASVTLALWALARLKAGF